MIIWDSLDWLIMVMFSRSLERVSFLEPIRNKIKVMEYLHACLCIQLISDCLSFLLYFLCKDFVILI